jgi:hypothetical protein
MSLGTVISLCDRTGNMVEPWAEAGYDCYCYDIEHKIRVPDDRIHKAAPGDDRAAFRSATPKGFARAVFLANAPHLKSELMPATRDTSAAIHEEHK